MLEHQCSIGAAEAERVRQHDAQIHIVAALPQDSDLGQKVIVAAAR